MPLSFTAGDNIGGLGEVIRTSRALSTFRAIGGPTLCVTGGMTDLMAPWELHPALVHFPIAFLVATAILDLIALRRAEAGRWATGFAVAGSVTGVAAVAAGFLAWWTIPGHTDGAHALMTWHIVVQSIAIGLFGVRAILGWRAPTRAPGMPARVIGWLGAAALVVGSTLGGHLVFRHGVGVTAAQQVPSGHDHAGGGHAH